MPDETQANGHDKKASTQTELEIAIDAQLRQTIGIMFRGVLVSCPGIQPEVVMKSIARLTAEMIGHAVVGDLAPVLTIRRECKEAFAEALGKQQIRKLPDGRQPSIQG